MYTADFPGSAISTGRDTTIFKEEPLMRKHMLFAALSLIVALLFTSLLWGETETTCPKSKLSQDVMTDPHCAKAAQCQMMMGKQMEPGENMMPMGHPMMQQMRMGPKSAPEVRHHGHPVEKALHHLGGPEYFLGKTGKLDLTDEQIEQLKGLKNEQRKWNIQKKADIGVAQVELEELLDNKTVNFDKIKTKISQIADMEKELLLSHLSTIQKTHKVLTAEQMEKAESMKKKGTGRRSHGPRQVIKEVIIEEAEE
jgi:Spy/CpxP family protein refolding chaperone